jgi:pyruvate ferredoxin oxidoreductase delta subunit
VINTAHSSQIALTLSQAGVSAGKEAFYYMRYDDSPERVQLPFIYYAVFGNPSIKVILPEEVEPVGSVFDTIAVLDSSLLVKSTSQRALLLDGAKKGAALVVNTSLKPDVILRLVRRYGCAQDWEGRIITLRAKKYGQNIALGMIGAIAKAMEPLYSIDDVIESLAVEGKSDSISAVRSAYEEADSLNVSLKAEDCEQYNRKSGFGEADSSREVKWWDREAYMSLKQRVADAPTALIEFGPKVSERNVGFKTSFARTFRPVIDVNKCINCKLCHVFCPDGAIDYDPIKVNYDYCKGCGICARVCGSKAISMPHELKVLEGLDEEEFLTIREALIEYAY